MKVITISGKAQHGKDTTAAFLRADLERHGNRVLVAHYGDLLKFICRSFFNWNGEKDKYGRQLLQYVGTDVIRAQKPNYWVDFLSDILRLFPDEWDFVLIPDARFPNEIERLRECGLTVTHIRVERPGFQSPLTEEQQSHPSETALDETTPDFRLTNDGSVEDLERRIANWTEENMYG